MIESGESVPKLRVLYSNDDITRVSFNNNESIIRLVELICFMVLMLDGNSLNVAHA